MRTSASHWNDLVQTAVEVAKGNQVDCETNSYLNQSRQFFKSHAVSTHSSTNPASLVHVFFGDGSHTFISNKNWCLIRGW